jgi:RNA polymerase sigma-70 factor (ECF subfamily)
MGNMYQERELIEKILGGNKTAFSMLVKKYERLVWVMVSRMVPDEDEIKDICQEAFIKVYLNLDKFNFNSKLSTWIATIAYRQTLNYLKKRRKNEFSEIHEESQDLVSAENPFLNFHNEDIKRIVHGLINQLPFQYRTVVTLYHLNDFSYKEIEEITQLPEGTVKSYLFRARKLMKDQLSKSFVYSQIKE